MLVRRFVDEYAAVADLLGIAEIDLRDADRASPPLRWVAVRENEVVGVADGRRRPDGRVFIKFGGTPTELLGPVSEGASREAGPLHALARSAEQRSELNDAGFVVEVVDDEFEISFETALLSLGRLRIPPGIDLVPAHELDAELMAALDTELRQDVPGTEGWVTTVAMWQAEMDSPEYDPSGYLVAAERATGQFCGLARFWRNADSPRLGLLAVTRSRRGSLLAAALLQSALEGASHWGSSTFQTSTSPSNRGTYPALRRLGAVPVSRRYFMKRSP